MFCKNISVAQFLKHPFTNAQLIVNSKLDRSFSSSSSSSGFDNNRLSSLYEVTYLPEDQKIFKTELPMANPFDVFAKPSKSSISKTIRQLISSKSSKLPLREYVQASKFDDLIVHLGSKEHFFYIPLPEDLTRIATA